MSKEEGAGWTLAEMFSRKLLVEEVLGLGKRARPANKSPLR
jgi:hypothetical protein